MWACGHVNERSREEIVELLSSARVLGLYHRDLISESWLREAATFPWFKHPESTLLVLRRTEYSSTPSASDMPST